MVIQQGEIYWIDFGVPIGSMPGYSRPCVVVQNNVFNASRIATLLVATLTSNLNLAQAPGNVLLRQNEAGLSQTSVVNVSQLMTVDKAMLRERVGKLSKARIQEIVDGIHLVVNPTN